jgi:hypothetical protein
MVVYVVYAVYLILGALVMSDAGAMRVAEWVMGLCGGRIGAKDGKNGECKKSSMYGSAAE